MTTAFSSVHTSHCAKNDQKMKNYVFRKPLFRRFLQSVGL